MATVSWRHLVWLLVLVGGALRGAAAAVRPTWHDELFTVWAAALPLRDLIAALRLDSGPPLQYLLTKILALTGMPELAAARSFAVVAGTLAVAVVARAAARAFGPRAAVVTAALLAVHPLAVAWSAEGRAYPLVLLAAAGAWERLEALAAGARRAAWGLAAYLALAVWSHGLGLVLLGAALLAALTLQGAPRRPALVGIAGAALSHLPWLPVAVAQPPGALEWMRGLWQQMPAAEQLLAVVRLLPPVAPFGRTLDLPSAPALLAVPALLVVAAGLALGARKPDGRRALVLAAVPAAGLLLLALLKVPAVYPGRTEALLLPAALGLLAHGLAARRSGRWVLAGLALGGLALSLTAISAWAAPAASPEAGLARALRRVLPDGGRVVIVGHWKLGLAHHLGDAAARYRLEIFPPAADRHPGWYDPASETASSAEVAALQRSLAGAVAGGTDVALVLPPPALQPAGVARMADRLAARAVLTTPWVQLRVRRGAPTGGRPRAGGEPGGSLDPERPPPAVTLLLSAVD